MSCWNVSELGLDDFTKYIRFNRSSRACPPSPTSSQYAAPESGEETCADLLPPLSANQSQKTLKHASAAFAPQSFSILTTVPTTLSVYHRRTPDHRQVRDRT